MRALVFAALLIAAGAWFMFINQPGTSQHENPEALAVLAATPLYGPSSDQHSTAGVWGDLAINRTQLAYVIDTYGLQTATVGLGDMTIRLFNGQVELDFLATGGCQRQVQFMPLSSVGRSMMTDKGREFFANAPQCREEFTLREIKLRTEVLLDQRFMQAPVIVPQINAELGIAPEDKVFDVVRKLGLPPNSGSMEVPVGIGGFSRFTTLEYPGVSVLFDGSYELVQQWHRYAGAATKASELVNSLNDVPTDTAGEDPVGELKTAMLGLLQDPDVQAGAEAISDIEDRLSPEIVMIRVHGKPTPAMLEAYRNSPY